MIARKDKPNFAMKKKAKLTAKSCSCLWTGQFHCAETAETKTKWEPSVAFSKDER